MPTPPDCGGRRAPVAPVSLEQRMESVMRKLMIAAAMLTATPALAQVNTGSGNGLVAVNIQDVSILNNFLNNDQIALLNGLSVPVTVQVPIGVAANVCNIS